MDAIFSILYDLQILATDSRLLKDVQESEQNNRQIFRKYRQNFQKISTNF